MRRVILLALLALALAGLAALTLDRVRSRGAFVERTVLRPKWSIAAGGAQALVYAPFAPGAAPALLVQAPALAVLWAPGGEKARASLPPNTRSAATGDLDGDGADELVTVRSAKDGPMVDVFDGALRPKASIGPVKSLGDPARILVADVDGDGKRDFVIGDAAGRIAAVNRAGRALWAFAFGTAATGEEAALRGMDDVRGGGKGRFVMAARRKGEVVVIDGRGDVVREETFAGLRRARALDLDGDGRDEVVVGTEDDGLAILPSGGPRRAVGMTSGRVTELRRIETDGNPRTAEVVAGNRDGLVWVVAGRQVSTMGQVDGRVTEVAGVDLDGDGRDEVVAASEPDRVTVLDPTGSPVAAANVGSAVARILGVPTGDGRRQVAALALSGSVGGWILGRERAPAWYSPLTVAGVGGLMVAWAGLVVVRRGRSLPALQVTDPTPLAGAGAAAARLHIEDLVRRGLASPEMAGERLAQLDAPPPAPRPAPPAGPVSPPPPPRRG
jgi:hypothetical protein